MDRRSFTMMVPAMAIGISGQARAEPTSPPGGQTQIIAAAAEAFLGLLAEPQRAKAVFPFVPQALATASHFRGGLRGNVDFVGEQYGASMWSNFPVSDVPRPGLRLGELGEAQRDAVMTLLQAMLSARGYQKVLDIMGSDQALADSGTPFAAGRDAYTLAILGRPGLDAPWMIQFGGHHLALNLVMSGGRGVLAPVLTGAQPAIYTAAGRTLRALAQENDKGFALLHAFDDAQRLQAIIAHRVSDLVMGPGQDGAVVAPAGLLAAHMEPAQRDALLDLALEWAGMVNDSYAAPRRAEITAGLDETRFAWSGPLTCAPGRNGASYFRIQGPRLFIEFSPQQIGGDPTMHVHTIYRDPANSYGRALRGMS